MNIYSSTKPSLKLVMVAGEVSADMYGAALIDSLKERVSLECYGLGGVKMAEAGQVQLANFDDLKVMGFIETLGSVVTLKRIYEKLWYFIERNDVDAIVLIDYPGFNLRLAADIFGKSRLIFYYISPKVWAWKQSRVHRIKLCVNHVLAIFPFELAFYKKFNVPCTYVGNPLLKHFDEVNDQVKHTGRKPHQIALLPGSRRFEIDNLLPILLKTAFLIQQQESKTHFVIPVASSFEESAFRSHVQRLLLELNMQKLPLEIVNGNSHYIMSESRLGIVASGTATLEACMANLPVVVVYKVSWLTYQIAKRFVKIKWISLINILAEKDVVKELIQSDANPPTIAQHALQLYKDTTQRDFVLSCYQDIVQGLKNEPSQLPSDVILREISLSTSHPQPN